MIFSGGIRCPSRFAWLCGLLFGCSNESAGPNSASIPTAPTPEVRSHWVDVTVQWGLPQPEFDWPDGTWQVPEIMAPGVAIFDADGDQRLDLLVAAIPSPGNPTAAAPNQLFRQTTPGEFEEMAAVAGLADDSATYGFAIGDFNNDGAADVYCCNFGHDRLFRNRGDGTFEDVTEQAGLGAQAWTCSAAFVDYDRDGDLDLYAVHYVDFDPNTACSQQNTSREFCSPLEYEPTRDTLYRNEGNGTFQDVSEAAGIELEGNGLGIACCDFDGDGWVDFYVANDAQPNHLWINQQDGTFREEAYFRGVAVNRHGKPEASMGVAIADADTDGDLDLFMTHITGENNTLFSTQSPGMFQDASISSQLSEFDRNTTGFGCCFQDFDLDGDVDLAVANGRIRRGELHAGVALTPFWQPYAEPNQLFLNNGDGQFVEDRSDSNAFADPVEISRGLAAGDLDGDGDTDLVVASLGGVLRVYRNDAPPQHHWLRVRPMMSDQVALGAIVLLHAGDRSSIALCTSAASYASSIEPVVTFGLGAREQFDAIEILWPDGLRERFVGTTVDQELQLVQGTGATIE